MKRYTNCIFLIITLCCYSCRKSNDGTLSNLPINCNGDNLIAEDFKGMAYPDYLAKILNKPVLNNTLSGLTAQQIAGQQGGLKMSITLAGNHLSGNSPVIITTLTSKIKGRVISNPFLTFPDRAVKTISGTVNSVNCTITFDGKDYYIAPVDNISAQVTGGSVFVPDDINLQKNCIGIYWVGRNNVNSTPDIDGTLYGITDIVGKMADFNRSGKYLIVGILPAVNEKNGTENYKRIKLTNDKLQKLYGLNFVPSVPPNIEEMSEVNFVPNTDDMFDISHGVFPRRLRSDSLNLNTLGHQILANRISKYLRLNSY